MGCASHPVSALDPPLGRRDAAAAGILLALIVVMFWPLATLRSVPVPNDLFTSDLHYAHVPFRVLMAESLRAGHLPFWTPLVYAGYPLLADSATGTFFPLNWLFIWLPWPTALNLLLLLTFWLAAVFMYLYGRTLGLARGACMVAGVAFGLSGFFIGHVRHPNLITAAIWLPAMLALIEGALRTGRRAYWLWLAPALALQIFAGGPPVVYVTLVGLAGYVALRLTVFRGPAVLGARRPPFLLRGALKDAAWAIGSLALGAALAGVQILPTAELAGVSERAAGLARDTAEFGALPWRDLLMFLYPYWNGDPGSASYGGRVFWENCAYVGLLPLAAALAAIPWLWRRSRMVPLLTLAVLAAGLVALGPNTPLFEAARKALPGFAGFRFPQRFLLWAILALCVLAGMGLTALTVRLRGWGRWLVVAAMVGLAFLDLWHLQRRQVPTVPVERWMAQPTSVAALGQDGRGRRVYTLGAEESFVSAYRRAGGWQGDLWPYVEQRGLLQPNSQAMYGLASPAGYADLTPGWSARVWGSSLQKGLARRLMEQGVGREIEVQPALQGLLDGWSVGWVLSPVALRASRLEQAVRRDTAWVYRNPGALPRARIVANAWEVRGDLEMVLLTQGAWLPDEVVLLATQPGPRTGLPGGGTGLARITSDEPTRLVVEAETSGPAWLVLADTWYPGWRAEVGGEAARIYRANLCQRAVHVGGGKHTVTFRYHATAYHRGLMISLLAAMVWLIAMGVVRRRPA